MCGNERRMYLYGETEKVRWEGEDNEIDDAQDVTSVLKIVIALLGLTRPGLLGTTKSSQILVLYL